MPIFRIKNNAVEQIRTRIFETEAELQRLTETNLDQFFGIRFIRSEFRNIDTLAFDESSRSPVLIEYKKDQHESVIDQGFSYLADVLDHKGDVKLEIEEKLGKKVDIDWSQTRILFIANQFSEYQVGAMSLKGLPFELWHYEVSEDGHLVLEQIKPPQKEVVVSQVLKKETLFQKVSKQLKPYTLEDNLRHGSDKTKELFLKLREQILALGEETEERPFQRSITYKIWKQHFVSIGIQKQDLRVYLFVDEKKFDDPKKITRDITKIGTVAGGNRDFKISSEEELVYAMGLIKQAYKAAFDKVVPLLR